MNDSAEEVTRVDSTCMMHQSPRSLGKRLFCVAIVVYLIAWCVGAVYSASVFRLKLVLFPSLIAGLPIIAAVQLYRRWNSVRVSDCVSLVLLLMLSTAGTGLVVRHWFRSGYHLPPSEEDQNWDKFGRELRKDRRFRNITHHRFRGVNWLKGSLQSEEDLEHLVELAKNCGIEDRRLDGPYQHSISITIPGTNRAREYH